MKCKQTPVASAVALLLMSATFAVQAQQATPAAPEKPAAELETVTVTGIRTSIEASLKTKREADTRIEVITAEDIGKMPDKNVADSLKRVPGVTISSASANEGGFDENDRVSLRGTSPSLTQTLINGHNIASGDWFVLNQSGTVGRSVSYSLLPSELVSKVIVRKSSEASLVEGGAAGSIDIITRRPLEFSKALTVEASIGAVYADLPSKTDPQLSALINWRNDEKNLGVMLQVFSEKRSLRRDGQEILGYAQIQAGSKIALSNPDLSGVYYPVLIGSALFEQKRERQGGLIDVQIKPTNDLTLDFSAFTSKLDASNYNRNYLLWGSRIVQDGAGQAPDAGYVVRNNTLVNANFSPVAGTPYGIYDQISRPESSSSSNFFAFDAKWRASDALSVSGQLGTSRGTGKTPSQDVAELRTGVGTGAGWGLNGIDSAADWNLGANDNSNPASAALDWIFGFQNVNVKDKESWGQIDAEYALDAGPLTALKFGVRAADHERSLADVVAQGPFGSGDPFDPANQPSGFTNYPGDFGSGLGGSFPRNVWQYSPGQLAVWNQLANRDPVARRYPLAEYKLDERSYAGYLQGDLSGPGWSGNVGLRLVRTEGTVTNYAQVDAATPGAITSAFGSFAGLVTDNNQTDLLPSANLRVDLQKDLLARFAVSRTMTRPDYSALAGSLSLSPPAVPGLQGSGSGGNPNLDPIRSNNFDANLEWYFAPRALLSAGVFYMDLTSYIGFGRSTQIHKTFDANNPDGYDAEYVVTSPVNSSGSVKGFELAYEQPLMKNFGVAANYTYANGEEDGGGDLVGTSKNTYNLIAFYEDDHFNVRVAYNFRSSFYSGLDRQTAFYQADTSSVSASLGYRINDNFSISLDGHNLNNPKLKYYALNEDQPRSIYQNGRQYFLTARIKY